MSLLSDLINLDLSDITEKVIAEYIWWDSLLYLLLFFLFCFLDVCFLRVSICLHVCLLLVALMTRTDFAFLYSLLWSATEAMISLFCWVISIISGFWAMAHKNSEYISEYSDTTSFLVVYQYFLFLYHPVPVILLSWSICSVLAYFLF